uniref:MARVEL domain-containing protein n=1 Tax=Anopheles farauti TaxID=69004 RepID=A0A182QTI8_9DIPT
MTGIFAQLSAGEPDALKATPEKQQQQVPSPNVHLVDVPVLDGGAAPASRCRFRAVCSKLVNMPRAELRNRTRLLQLLLTIGALALIRPQYSDGFQWITLYVLVHSFVISFVLFWDRRLCGTIIRKQLPLVNWRVLELRYTSIVTMLLYIMSFGVFSASKGYRGDAICNWVSSVLTLLTALAYGAETWLQLRDKYDGHTVDGH